MEKDAGLHGGRESVVGYHQRSKHHPDRYAKGPEQMDWAAQPDPFRRFAGVPELLLPLAADRQKALFSDLFIPDAIRPEVFSLESIAVLLELSFGLSAWKSWGGERWALRCNPSSGNLHPTECSIVVSGLAGIDDGIYHYACRDHLLERRCTVSLPFTGLLVALSSIHWREAWKYGERAFRYCQHDIGHALAALCYAAGVLGWRLRLLDDWGDSDLAAFLGLDRERDFGTAEREVPDLVCAVVPATVGKMAVEPMLTAAVVGQWQGRANVLSGRHLHQWPVIDEVHEAACKPRTTTAQPLKGWESAELEPTTSSLRAADLIRQRRSAQAFDGVTTTSEATLWRLLDATLPRPNLPPFDAWPALPRVHLLLFIHRVEGVAPGIYIFPRREGVVEAMRPLMRNEFEWAAVEQCPAHLPLYRLRAGDCRDLATTVCCHQEIAGDGVLSMAMLAEFDAALTAGAWWYRRLFWEAGMIGQALYLEAEAAGLRGTGIGCFFDDAVHKLCGLNGTRFQDLYHFTLGGPRTDSRIQTLPPYGHLRRA
jgi:SagB-type dehydrogenase family enzyme